jgi:tRNA A-37 threonylcarbamoyl transferase component Bud32
LNAADGLPDADTNQQAFYDDPDGSVWIGAGTTLTHWRPPADFLDSRRVPEIFISAFSWNHGPPQMADSVAELPHGSNITVHLGSLQFDRRSALNVRYRLLPADTSWHGGKLLDLNLGNVRWGAHTIEVQARLGLGPWSQAVSRSFAVQRPMWLSWQGLTAIAMGLFLCAAQTRIWVQRWQRSRRPLPEIALWREAARIPEVRDLIGSTLDSRYQVGRVIAQGGFATVLQGRDLQEGDRRCAIKVFRRELLAEESISRRFDQEVAALEKVRHANIVPIYDHGTTPDGVPYLVMEFIDGQTLREILEEGPLSPQRTASFVRQAGSALDAIHADHIYHRDLKPENIMIRAQSQPGEDLVLIDFSIAIIQEPNQSLRGLSRAEGTFDYMAPEHSIGYADASTDIYNLAKLIIEMLTGKRLSSFFAEASLNLPTRVRALLSTLPVKLSSSSIDLIATALEFHPSLRLQGARNFADSVAADLLSLYPS